MRHGVQLFSVRNATKFVWRDFLSFCEYVDELMMEFITVLRQKHGTKTFAKKNKIHTISVWLIGLWKLLVNSLCTSSAATKFFES